MKLSNWIKNRLPKRKLKPVTHKDLELHFQDLQGRNYYRIPSVMALPLERQGTAQDFIMWMSAGMTSENLKMCVNVFKECLNTLYVENATKEKTQDALIRAGAAINEIEMASNLVIHTDLLYEFVAVHYIREDEPIDQFVQTIQNEKVAAFKEMVSHGGAYAFFSVIPELRNVNESMNLSPEDWTALWDDCQRKVKRQIKVIEYLKSRRKFERDKKIIEST